MSLNNRVPHGQPAAELNCRFGYPEHHAAFALLHVAVLGWFIYAAPRAAWGLHGLVGGSGVFFILIHALLGGVCSSTTISAAVHAHLPTSPLSHIRLYGVAGHGLFACAFAVHFELLQSEGAARTAKLVFLIIMAGATTLTVVMHMLSGPTDRAVSAVLASTAVLAFPSLFSIHSTTKSRPVALVLFFIIPALLTAIGVLNSCWPTDIDHRLLHHPSTSAMASVSPSVQASLGNNEQTPHWSVLARCALSGTIHIASRAGVSHAASQLHRRPSLIAPAPNLSRRHKVSELLWLSIVVGLAAVMAKTQINSSATSKWGMGDLFTELAAEDIGLLCWFGFCGFALIAIWITGQGSDGEPQRAAKLGASDTTDGPEVIRPSMPQRRHISLLGRPSQ